MQEDNARINSKNPTFLVPHVLLCLCMLKQKWERILLNELPCCCGRTLEGEQTHPGLQSRVYSVVAGEAALQGILVDVSLESCSCGLTSQCTREQKG